MNIECFINQVENKDKHLLKLFINNLFFVSNDMFERYITDSIVSEYACEPKTALFTIQDINEESYDSSDKIGYILENIRRQYPRYLYINPSIECLKAEKIERILLVEDNISSGKKIIKFLNDKNNKIFRTLKSWVSYKRCTIDILVYALYEKGEKNIQQHTKKISKISKHVYVPERSHIYTDELIQLFKTYSSRTIKPRIPLGYGDVKGLIVFEHGCPNSLPVIFWSHGKNKSWIPLFPNRGMDNDVCEELKLHSSEEFDIDKIADMGRYKLALNLLEQIENKRLSKEAIRYLTILTYSGRGVRLENLNKYILIPEAELNQLLDNLKKWGYIEAETKITQAGKYLLNRYSTIKKNVKTLETTENAYFFPKVFRGVRQWL